MERYGSTTMAGPETRPASEAVRGQVEAVGPAGVKIARRWWALDPAAAIEGPEVGQLVVAEVRAGLVVRLTCLASPDPDGCPPAT